MSTPSSSPSPSDSSVASAAPSEPPVTIDCHPPMPPLNQHYTENLMTTDILTLSSVLRTPSPPNSAESFYIASGNDKAVLFAMAIGMDDVKGDTLADLDKDDVFINYKGKNKRTFTPSQVVMAEQRKRRKALSGDTKKVGMSTSKAVLKMWLNDNPVTNATDLKFVRGEVMNFKTNLENFTSQRAKSKDLANSEGAGNWSGMAPFLRMIHATLEDDQSRLQYQKSFDISTREQVDGRHNAATKKVDVWERVAELWNNSDFKPKSQIYGHLHNDFAAPIDISFEAVSGMGALSPKKAKVKFTGLVAKLNTVKAKWEASGQGIGGRLEGQSDESENGTNVIDDENEFGSGALAKADFLNGKTPVVLYLWEFGEKLNVLSAVLQRISGSCGLDGEKGPSLLNQKADKKRGKLEDEEKAERSQERKLLQQMGRAITATTDALFVFNSEEMKKRICELKERIFDAEDKRDDMVDAGVHGDRIARQDKRIKTLSAVLEGQQHALARYHVSTASDTMGATSSGGDEDE